MKKAERIIRYPANHEQCVLPVLGHELADGAVASGNLELYQQIREPDVLHRIEPSCGSHAQSASEISFAAAGGTQQDDVVVLLDVVAGAEPQQLLLLQPSVGQILHILQTSSRIREGCLADQLVQMVILSGIPFRIHQKTEPVLKGHVLELRIGKLVLQGIGHNTQPHFTQLGYRCFSQHHLFPLP